MKHTRPAILVLLFSLLACGCGIATDISTELYYKLDNPIPVRASEVLDTLCTVKYSVDGTSKNLVIRDQKNLDYFLYTMLSLSAQGSEVQIQTSMDSQVSGRRAFIAGERPIIFTTNDSNRAKEWVKRMLIKGYKVSIVYDKKTKKYTCTAYHSK